MCDTIVIVEADRVLFAKNSDRDANEAQVLDWHPAADHEPGAKMRCTWLTIPQVERTHAVLLSRPFWMFGAEMGTNEFGVTIGNEAVFTNVRSGGTALTGMDLVRLGLERAETAAEAVEIMIEILETHGQGGRCGFEDPAFTYDSSFLVADPREAFVLETAGRNWATERVTRGVRTISNGLTIRDFARRHGRWLETTVACAQKRQRRSTELASQVRGPADLMRLLRDHGGRDEPVYHAVNGTLDCTCMHGGGAIASSVSTGALVSELRADGCRHWATGTSGTCTSVFKPVDVNVPVIGLGNPTGTADGRSLWWRHEHFHRLVMRDPERVRDLFSAERDELEARWLAAPPDSQTAFDQARRLTDTWTARVRDAGPSDVRPLWAKHYWSKRSRRADLSIGP